MIIPISFASVHEKADVSRLVDSGVMENFLDHRMVWQLKLGAKKLDQPKKIQNVDGTPNQAGELTDYCNLQLILGEQERL
jgi:hypothetical protein